MPSRQHEIKRLDILDRLRRLGLLIKSSDYFAKPGHSLPVEVCTECGALVDATLLDKHYNHHRMNAE